MRKENPDQIKTEIKERFVKVALCPQDEQKFPVGRASAKRLGYDASPLKVIPTLR